MGRLRMQGSLKAGDFAAWAVWCPRPLPSFQAPLLSQPGTCKEKHTHGWLHPSLYSITDAMCSNEFGATGLPGVLVNKSDGFSLSTPNQSMRKTVVTTWNPIALLFRRMCLLFLDILERFPQFRNEEDCVLVVSEILEWTCIFTGPYDVVHPGHAHLRTITELQSPVISRIPASHTSKVGTSNSCKQSFLSWAASYWAL